MRCATAVALLASALLASALLACERSRSPRVSDGARSASSAPTESVSALPVAFDAEARRIEAPPKIPGGGPGVVTGRHGMVVSVEAQATRAGVAVLERGGNAADAAAAVGYALAVTHPSAGNVGGGGFLLVRRVDRAPVAIDFRERAPKALTRAKFDAMIAAGAVGTAAAGVPGTVAGLNLLQERFGKLPRAAVLAPAIELARRGHVVGHREALTIGWSWPSLRKDPEARRVFGNRRGKPHAAGARLVRSGLADTLERIAREGDAGFYGGEVARRLVASMGDSGLITLEDLGSYRARIRKPLRVDYRGLDVYVAPPPSAGGVAIALMLELLESTGAHELEGGSADELHLFVEVAKRAHAERRFGVVDPDAFDPSEEASRRRRWLDGKALLSAMPAIDAAHATPSSSIHPDFQRAMKELEHTTHFAVVDRGGNAVTCTTTLSAGFGAKVVVPNTGIVLNNSVAAFGTVGEDQPVGGRRMTSSMAPTLVQRHAQTVLLLGSPGGDTIPNTVVQVFRNVVDRQMTLDRAVEAPRIHHGFVPDEVRIEQKRPVPAAIVEQLKARGHRIKETGLPLGDANNIAVVDGVAFGFADPREGGLALAPEEAPSGK